MTPSEKEMVGFAAAGGLLAGLYAWQRSGGGGGLGQTGPTVTLTIDGNTPVETVPPASYFFIHVCGLHPKTDWAETNANSVIYGSMGNPLFANSKAGYNNTLPAAWVPFFTSDPRTWPGVVWGTTGPLNNAASWATMILADGCWTSGQTAPQQPGTYTLLIAVNGRIAFTMPLVVTGTPGAYTGGGIKAGASVPGAGAPTLQQQATPTQNGGAAPAPTAAAPAVQPSGSGGSAAASSAAGAATVTMVPAGSGLTGFLEGSIFGIPAWILLAAAAGAVWYFTSGKES